MSKHKADIPSYRRHRASGQAVVTLNGVDHYLGPWNTEASEPNTTGSRASGWSGDAGSTTSTAPILS